MALLLRSLCKICQQVDVLLKIDVVVKKIKDGSKKIFGSFTNCNIL